MKYVITNLDGVALGEPRAYERATTFAVSAPASSGLRLRNDDPLWGDVSEDEAMLKVYDEGDDLCYYGPMVTDEENGDGQGSNVRLVSSDLSWRLGKRLIGKDLTGVGLKYTSQDTGVIATDVLAKVNLDDPTGITIGTVGSFISLTTTYLWKPALAAISELGALAGSYEWQLRYTDGTPPTVQLDLLSALGQDRTDEVFLEYGTGRRNVQSYRRVRDRTRLATHVWALGSGSTLVAAASDSAAADALRSRYEDVVTYGDIGIASLLDALGAAHVAIRNRPRLVIDVTPTSSGPVFGEDYSLGDLVTARIVSRGSVRASGTMRVWGVTVSSNNEGVDTAVPRLVAA